MYCCGLDLWFAFCGVFGCLIVVFRCGMVLIIVFAVDWFAVTICWIFWFVACWVVDLVGSLGW